VAVVPKLLFRTATAGVLVLAVVAAGSLVGVRALSRQPSNAELTERLEKTAPAGWKVAEVDYRPGVKQVVVRFVTNETGSRRHEATVMSLQPPREDGRVWTVNVKVIDNATQRVVYHRAFDYDGAKPGPAHEDGDDPDPTWGDETRQEAGRAVGLVRELRLFDR
jgi:hypothetical protein